MEINYQYTIGEFSRLTGVNIRTLRYYDEIKLLEPVYTDPDNKFRYYTSMQSIYVNFIIHLKRLGFPLKEIKRLLYNEKDLNCLEKIFSEKQNEISELIIKLKEDEKIINDYLIHINQLKEGKITDFSIKIKHLKQKNIVFITEKNWKHDKAEDYYKIYKKLTIIEQNYQGYGWYFFRHHNKLDKIDFNNYNFDFCREIRDKSPLKNKYIDTLQEGDYGIITNKGNLSATVMKYKELEIYLEKNNYKIVSNPLVNLVYPIFITNPSDKFGEQVRQILVRVEKV